MEKFIINKYNTVVYNTVTNSIEEEKKSMYVTLYKMTNDGEVVSKDQVLPYTKDSYLLSISGANGKDLFTVIDDKVTVFDLDNLLSIITKHRSDSNICNGESA